MGIFNHFKKKNKKDHENTHKYPSDDLNTLFAIAEILDTKDELAITTKRNILSKNKEKDESKIRIFGQTLYGRDKNDTYIYSSVFIRITKPLRINSDMSTENKEKAIEFMRTWQVNFYELWADKFKEASSALVTAVSQVHNEENKESIVKDLRSLIEYIIIEALNSIEETDLEIQIKSIEDPSFEKEITKASSKIATEAIKAHKSERVSSHV